MNKACIASPLNCPCGVCSMLVAIFDDLCGEVSYHFWKPFTSPQLYLGNLGRLRSKKSHAWENMITWTHGRNPLFPKKSPKNWLSLLGKPFHAMVSLGKASRYEPKIRARDKDLGALRVGIPQGVEIRATWTSSFLCDSPSIFVLREWLGSQNQRWYKQIFSNIFYNGISLMGISCRQDYILVGFQIWISKTWNLLVSCIFASCLRKFGGFLILRHTIIWWQI